jgi:hypothetical protein
MWAVSFCFTPEKPAPKTIREQQAESTRFFSLDAFGNG